MWVNYEDDSEEVAGQDKVREEIKEKTNINEQIGMKKKIEKNKEYWFDTRERNKMARRYKGVMYKDEHEEQRLAG